MPWRHVTVLLDRLDDTAERDRYALHAVATYTYDQLPDDIRQALPPADSIARAIEASGK